MASLRMKQRVASRRAEDREIEVIYRQHCCGMQINVMRIGELFAMARTMLQQSATRERIGAAMIEFVQKESV